MEINKEVTVTISTEEIEQLLTEYLLTRRIKVSSIHFSINPHNDENDWRSEFPPTYQLDRVICKGIDI